MQYKVPQNIDIQDRVIGPLTLKQFLYVIAGGAIILILYFSIPSFIGFIFFPLAILVGGIFGALAFYSPEGRTLEGFLGSVSSTLIKPRKRIWKKEVTSFRETAEKMTEEKNNSEKKAKKFTTNDLEKLAFIVDSGGFEKEIKSRGIAAAINPDTKAEPISALNDSLADSENPNKEVMDLLENAREKADKKRKEPTVQSMATVDPEKEFKYDKI